MFFLLIEENRTCALHGLISLFNAYLFIHCVDLHNRYANWLSSGLAARKTGATGSHPGCEWAIAALPDDLIYVCLFSQSIKTCHAFKSDLLCELIVKD